MKKAHVQSGTLYPLLAHMERKGMVTIGWELHHILIDSAGGPVRRYCEALRYAVSLPFAVKGLCREFGVSQRTPKVRAWLIDKSTGLPRFGLFAYCLSVMAGSLVYAVVSTS